MCGRRETSGRCLASGCLEAHFWAAPGPKGVHGGRVDSRGRCEPVQAQEPLVPAPSREHPHPLWVHRAQAGPRRGVFWPLSPDVQAGPPAAPNPAASLLLPASAHPHLAAPSAPPPTSQRSLLTELSGVQVSPAVTWGKSQPLFSAATWAAPCAAGVAGRFQAPATHARSPGGQGSHPWGPSSQLSHAGGGSPQPLSLSAQNQRTPPPADGSPGGAGLEVPARAPTLGGLWGNSPLPGGSDRHATSTCGRLFRFNPKPTRDRGADTGGPGSTLSVGVA